MSIKVFDKSKTLAKSRISFKLVFYLFNSFTIIAIEDFFSF